MLPSTLLDHMTYAPAKFGVATSNTLGSRSYEVLPSTLLDHVTYAPAKFGVATSNSSGGDAFTRNSNAIANATQRLIG